jgi:uncharacterized membrane protein
MSSLIRIIDIIGSKNARIAMTRILSIILLLSSFIIVIVGITGLRLNCHSNDTNYCNKSMKIVVLGLVLFILSIVCYMYWNCQRNYSTITRSRSSPVNTNNKYESKSNNDNQIFNDDDFNRDIII